MAKIGIIFHSGTGTTAQLAKAVVVGVNSVVGAEGISFEITDADIVEGRYCNEVVLSALDEMDGIIFGSPTFMGTVSAQFKAFADASSDRWEEQRWVDKVAAGFTIGAHPSGDQLSTLQYLQIFSGQHSMLWVGLDMPEGGFGEHFNRMGANAGLVAVSWAGEMHATDLATAEHLGRRVAGLAQRLGP